MPNRIEISASSMTGLLGAVAASKTAQASSSKRMGVGGGTGPDSAADLYDLSRYKALRNRPSKTPTTTLPKQSRDRKPNASSTHKIAKLSAQPPSLQDQLASQALERKAKIYEATIRGQKGGLSTKELEGSALDVEAKRARLEDMEESGTSGEEDEDGARPVAAFTGRISAPRPSPPLGEPQPPEEDWIETKDEFGRDVLVPRDAFPIHPPSSSPLDPQRTLAFTQTESAAHLQHIGARYGPQTEFPVLEPPEGRKRKASSSEEPVEKYFDAGLERRQMGTGFYALSRDPAERLRQQAELRARDLHTQSVRAAAVTPHNDLPALTPAQIALQTRKRLVQAKKLVRLQKPPVPDPSPPAASSSS